ncbi:MAG TPA: alpha/beta hydrolase-fold protein [Chthonomonadaceae bacterium]|nr:alpha/beta hydrolase-fold protein [Chthonomonadaceae bacterium]
MRFGLAAGLAAAGLASVFTCVAAQRGAAARQSAVTPAPLIEVAKRPVYTGGFADGDYQIAPPYMNAPELTRRDNVPHGTVSSFTMESTDSKIYSGIEKNHPGEVFPYHRSVTVYVPSQYKPGTAAPFLVSQDSMGRGELPTILDNLIADHRLPAMVAIMINSGGGDAQGSERGLEYDTVSGKYAEFIESEVLPRVSQECHVTLTKDPNGRMTMGGSSGAACAFTMGWFHPDLYHRLLLYSGTFVNQQSPFNPASPHGAWEYHEHFIMAEKPKPLRIWMEVGENDLRSHDPESTYHNWPMANERMASVLKAKHYHYQYVFAQQAGHVDGRVVRQTLPAALEYVWKGYRAR